MVRGISLARRWSAGLALCLAAGAAPARAQHLGSVLSDYTLTGWTEREGLASPRVTAIAQTLDGYLWVGTTTELMRFDGNRFLDWSAFATTELPQAGVATLCSARDGSLWVGYSNGTIVRIRDREAKAFLEEEGAMTGGNVAAIIEDRDGVIWAATRNGLIAYRGGRWETIGEQSGLPAGPVLTAYQDELGDFWAGSFSGVYRQRAGEPRFEEVVRASYFAHRVTRDPSGTVWITDPRTGFRRLREHSTRPSIPLAPLPEALGVQVMPDSRGSVWVATLGQGLWRVREAGGASDVGVLNKTGGLQNDSVRCLIEDHEGNLWIGTDYGLYRLSPHKVIPLDDLGVARVVEAGDDGSMWVGTSTGLLRFKDDARHGDREKLTNSFVTALHRDATGAIWVATDRGIARYRDGRLSPVAIRGAEQLNRIYSMTTGADGELWLCDYNQGLFRAHGGGLHPVALDSDLDHRAIIAIHADQEDRIWLSFSGEGMGYVERANPRRLVKLTDAPVASARLYSVVHEAGGPVWLATSAGIWQYSHGRAASISDRNGLPSSRVVATALGRDGRLWLGTTAGIVRLDVSAFDAASRDPAHRVSYGLWDASDGAAGLPLWLGMPSAARDSAGRLWFVTANGISIADPSRLHASTTIPPVRIESIFSGAHRFDLTRPLRLPPQTSPLEIEYTTVMLSAPHRVGFRYRLENFDRAWTEAGIRREALYTNLPPGHYRFQVMATAIDGSAGSSSAALEFVIAPTFFQTPWFYAALLGTGVLGIWRAWRLRAKYMQRQFSLVINERIRMSREIHDTLLQSMIGVALQLDVLAASQEMPEETKTTLTRVRRQLEEDIRETRQSIWKLRSPKLDKDDLAATLRDTGVRLTANTPVRFTLTVVGPPRRCNAEVEQQVLRIGEQAILNSIRHGSATQVHVTLGFDADRLQLRVADNGRGFDPAQFMAGDEPQHYGLAGMKERAEGIGGRFHIDTHPGRGTVVEAAVPLKQS